VASSDRQQTPGRHTVNRAQRRAADRRINSARIVELQNRVETTGLPGRVHGLTDACSDCHADGEFVLLPGRRVVGQVFHDDGCPAAAGITKWKPAQL
jgi:hypothetical protein